jgi:hypothetical protein
MNMVGSVVSRVMSVCVAGSLLFGSAAASAATTVAVPQPNPWAVLTAMSSGAPAAVMCGAAASAASAQTPVGGCVLPALDAPPAAPMPAQAVPLVPAAATGGTGISPLLLGLLAIAAGVGIFAAAGGGGNKANSPA